MAFACSLDKRICNHIARGNKVAFDIISQYHMDEVRKIRNHMLEILRDKYFYSLDKLEQAFNEAVIYLSIEVEDLLVPTVTLVSVEPVTLKLKSM